MSIVDDLIAKENESDLTSYKFNYDNIMMWPLVRYLVYSGAINKEQGLDSASVFNTKKSIFSKIKYYIDTILKSPYRLSQTDIIYFSPAILNIKKDTIYINRIYDHYAQQQTDKSAILEEAFNNRYFFPRSFPHAYAKGLIILKSMLKSKLSVKKVNQHEIDPFVVKLKESFGEYVEEGTYKLIENNLLFISKILPSLHSEYIKFFKKTKPKVIFVNCASYGSESYLLKWAKQQGIATAEIQHGLITGGCPAYNYPEKVLCDKEYRNYLPDYLLTFGDYWAEGSNLPSEKVIIGNPQFDVKIEKEMCHSFKRILILSDGNNRKFLSDIVTQLCHKLDKTYKVVLRLHPSEKEKLHSYWQGQAKREDMLEIDCNPNIYDSFVESHVIVGGFSFALFEALYFNKPVYVKKSSILDLYKINHKSFNYFNDIEELKSLICTDSVFPSDNVNHRFWADNWRENFERFICKVL